MIMIFVRLLARIVWAYILGLAFNGLLFWICATSNFWPSVFGVPLNEVIQSGLLAFPLAAFQWFKINRQFMREYQLWENDFFSHSN